MPKSGLTLKEVYDMENGQVLIESYYGFGKITFKFFRQENGISQEWSLSCIKKKNDFVLDAKRDSTKNYASKVTLDGIGELPFHRVLSKEDGRKFWEMLNNNGFNPTKETQKKL